MRLTQRARSLRRTATQAERAAWHLLRDRRLLGIKFRRQYPFGNFIIDFYSSELRLAIELDGSVHSQPSQEKKDARREACLERMGVRVVRIPNGMVLEDPEAFLKKVRQSLPSPGAPRHPLPMGEGCNSMGMLQKCRQAG